ncbi:MULTISPECIES: arsenite methyltransferase [unclassified Nocardia]|uniref:arsenite methyltransferase n=1 Tax=unclassified Nocardia TaxID=2637762 RepID=UPI0024A99FCC|nr:MULTISPECIES: arsenite methyltransferase [unclassified Nocardia]
MTLDQDGLREQVRARYASAARQFTETAHISDDGCCSGADCCSGPATFDPGGFGGSLYTSDDQAGAPADAVAASLGCGNPVAVADVRDGDTVLDLGSGAGLDVLLSARRVGPTGKAYGLDMTAEMLALAERNARAAGADNIEFLSGTIEAIPLATESVDVVISNCVINLSADKSAVFAESFRVLRPGGRLGVSDVVAEDHLTPADRAARGDHVGCIAGALTFAEYRAGLEAAGFGAIELIRSHQVADGMHSVIVKAVKPL